MNSFSNDTRSELNAPSKCETVGDLSQHEIEEGLHRLRVSLERRPLPFIILIEDDEREMDLFKNALRRAGVEVEFMHFKDGRLAIDFFRGKGGFADREMYPLPNLTILDFKLTHSSGLNILEEIRTSPHLKELVVVGLTACEDLEQIEHAHALKINDCIRKPQNLAGLVKVVEGLNLTWLSNTN